jgi:hypothetical protein
VREYGLGRIKADREKRKKMIVAEVNGDAEVCGEDGPRMWVGIHEKE